MSVYICPSASILPSLKMLFRFTSNDMLNTTLVDVATDRCAYTIVTTLASVPTVEKKHENSPSSSSGTPVASSSNLRSPTVVGSSPSFLKKRVSSCCPEGLTDVEQRRTIIANASGTVLADVDWKNRRPTITIGDEKVGALTDLFGSSTVRFMPKILAIPTRFDTEYVWIATPESLTLFDYDTETVKGSFHQNAVRVPSLPKVHKAQRASNTRASASSKSLSLLSSPSSLSIPLVEECEGDTKAFKFTLLQTHIPGVGSNYLEFSSHPLAHDVEIILSFLMMEILRRGRFGLTLYTFEKPKLWHFKEARDTFIRRLRRSTV